MIPFAASASRYSEWLRALINEGAEIPFPSITGKEQARVGIEGGLVLSVPVAGGAGVLKRKDCRDVMISGHGRWQDVHLGALKAAYGKAPYFPYIYPEVEKIYANFGQGKLADLNGALHSLAVRWLGMDDKDMLATLRRLPEEKETLIRRVAGERKRDICMNHSIFSALFRLGKESLFAILEA